MSVEVGHSGLDRVLEKLATSDKVTLVVERQPEGKMRVTSSSWEHEKVLFRDQVLEVRCVEGRPHVSRKVRRPDTWDRPTPAYDPYGPGVEDEEDVTGYVDERASRVTSALGKTLDGLKLDASHVTDARISNRARKALMRARRKKGLHCVTIHVTNGELDRFEAAGYLDPEKRGDRAAKARAIECFITEYLP